MSPTLASRFRAVTRSRNVAPTLVTVLVAAPLVAAVVTGEGNPIDRLAQSSGSAWVASEGAGTVTLIDGPSEEVVDTLPAPGAAAGDVLSVVQREASALVSNQTRGTLARVDGATYAAGTPVLVADPGSPVTVLQGGDQAYVVDPVRRTTAVLDADALTLTATISLASTPGSGQSAVDDDGRLWVVDSEGTGLASFRGDDRVVRAPADARAQVILVRGRAVLADLAHGQLGTLGGDGQVDRWSCLDVRPDDTVQLLGSDTADRVYAAVAQTGNVVVARLDTGDCQGVVRVAEEAGHDFGPMVQSDRFLFVPDRTTGRTTIIDTADSTVVDSFALTPPGNRLELASKDGIVFFNDLDGDTAGVLTFDGETWTQGEALQKYAPADASSQQVVVPQDQEPAPAEPTPGTTAPAPEPTSEPTPSTPPPAGPTPPVAAQPAPRAGSDSPGPGSTPTPGPAPSDAPPAPPSVASLTATPAQVQAGEPATFEATVSGEVTSWSWRIATSGGTELATATSAFSTGFTFPADGDPNVVVTVTVSGPGGSSAPRQLALTVAGPPVATLTVTVAGGGTIDVDGSPCSDVCTFDLTPGTTAGLSIPSRQFPAVFDGWGGACSGTGGCDVVVSEDTAVTAAFHQAPVEPEDCLTTDRANLTIVDEGGGSWLLTDGTSRMFILDSQEDAQNALIVAQHYASRCFIGRPDSEMMYWNGPNAGEPVLSRTDCISHDPAAAEIIRDVWRLVAGNSLLATFENEADAGRGLTVARSFSRMCFVGRVSPPGEITYFLP
ncbi:hypothetical protein [Cellulomonas sp. Leaf334]|uniref:hypothetical protein n=1 Tax=Cellulomonas sp. Leaf334 TaxID=1736339 RepID=UPI0006F8B9B4|nr:hypothetical protein [Cellulomonas sp. Leaf334]KQR16288.1 hypothetical protein ASF78_02465 [Cellulomonas sp. Leaf334]